LFSIAEGSFFVQYIIYYLTRTKFDLVKHQLEFKALLDQIYFKSERSKFVMTFYCLSIGMKNSKRRDEEWKN